MARLPFSSPLEFADFAQHKIPLQSTDAKDEENSVEVVNLMLKGAGQQVIGLSFKPFSL
jgi:hypothetical protein